MRRLSATQIRWLRSIADPRDVSTGLFPPTPTLRVLLREGFVRAGRPAKNDIFARMTGAIPLKVTAAGRRALAESPKP